MQEFRHEFQIPGKIKAKQSFKISRNGNKYTPRDVKEYAKYVAACFRSAYPNHLPEFYEGYQIEIDIIVYQKFLKSFSHKQWEQALLGHLRPTTKPDWDNIAKNICDSLNGVVYPDDKAIIRGTVSKFYAPNDVTVVQLRALKYE